MNIKATQIPDKLKYPPAVKSKLSALHSGVIDYVSRIYTGRYQQRQNIVKLINTISYIVVSGDSFPPNWTVNSPFDRIEFIDDDTCKAALGDLYVIERLIDWDIPMVEQSSSKSDLKESEKPKSQISKFSKLIPTVDSPTPKEDLYIRPPVVPRFNVNKIWASGIVDNISYAIYTSEPEIPMKQNEISVTTDVDKMTSKELMNLYPNRFIPTRAPSMYEEIQGLPYHNKLGVVLPISGYTELQLIDNLVRYPHIFRLQKQVDGDICSFYSTIEIDQKLYKVSEIWNSLPESKIIPYTADFVKEYVVRRYLLERDKNHIKHRYQMYGELEPFLTLFTTPSDYAEFGYPDAESLARQCVVSRVEYKQSRNPILRRLKNE